LKQDASRVTTGKAKLRAKHPREQGLKLFLFEGLVNTVIASSETSTRTRIETPSPRAEATGHTLRAKHPREQGLKLM